MKSTGYFAALWVLATFAGVSCSGKSLAPTESAFAPLELEMLPLAQGTVWSYDFYLQETSLRNMAAGQIMTLKTSFGRMQLHVRRETPGGFTRSWQLDTEMKVDSIRLEAYLDYKLDSLSLSLDPFTFTRSYTIFYERDTLWYVDNGLRDYMMPGRFMPGGTVNLKIFNFPGTDFFLEPMPYSSRWASGDMVYLLQDAERQSSVKIGGFEGVLGVSAISRELTGLGSGERRDRELRYTLVENATPVLASSPSRN